MANTLLTFSIALIAAVGLTAVPGCSKKAVQSAGDQTSHQGTAQAGGGGSFGSPDGSSSGFGSGSGVGTFPDTTMQSGTGGLKGLDKNPSEERVGSAGLGSPGNGTPSSGGSGSGTLLAKADPSGSAGRQMEEIRAEQAASSAAGLRDVFFGYDSWTISEEGRQALSRDADWMKSNLNAVVKVEGHCDERGTAAYNLVLGEKRAKAVRNYLVELGVGANRLSVVSYGKERPFCNEHVESCYQQNRRGHLVLRTGK